MLISQQVKIIESQCQIYSKNLCTHLWSLNKIEKINPRWMVHPPLKGERQLLCHKPLMQQDQQTIMTWSYYMLWAVVSASKQEKELGNNSWQIKENKSEIVCINNSAYEGKELSQQIRFSTVLLPVNQPFILENMSHKHHTLWKVLNHTTQKTITLL